MHFIYQQQLEDMKEKGRSETDFIVANIKEDLEDRSAAGFISNKEREKLFRSYSTYYKEQGIELAFAVKEEVLLGDIDSELLGYAKDLEDKQQQILIHTQDKEKKLYVITRLTRPYDKYILVYAYSLNGIIQSHNKLMRLTMILVTGISLLLAIGLYFILKYLTRPLSKLEEGVIAIGEGKYDEKLLIAGNDEFAELGRHFDQMSSKISSQFEALKEADRKKQLLIDNMAHEFRTPLTSISGYASYLKVAVASEDERLEALDYIISESERLQKLSRIILRSAEMREEELKFEKVPVKPLLEKVKESSLLYAKEKGAKLIFDGQIEALTGSSVLIESLLLNLIENALRACKDNEGRVEVSIFQEEMHPIIKVSDNGIGMEAKEIEKITEPFYRVDKARSRKAGGVGLGASLCKQIVAMHEGEMRYTSEVGKGTTVEVHFLHSL